MRLARARSDDGIRKGEYRDGILHTDDGEYVVERDDLLAPCRPSALYCVGRNYTETLDQMEYDRPEEPDFFIKPPVSVIPTETPIPYPTFSEEVTYAGELAAVIGQECKNVPPEAVPEVVRGYTIMNDVDALDQQGRTARKAFDGSGPLGPWIETELDPRGIDMHTEINGETRQEANTELMLFDPYEIVSYLSERFTFSPGDVVAFGSPANPGTIEPGDEIEITYEGVGTLRNSVTQPDRESTPSAVDLREEPRQDLVEGPGIVLIDQMGGVGDLVDRTVERPGKLSALAFDRRGLAVAVDDSGGDRKTVEFGRIEPIERRERLSEFAFGHRLDRFEGRVPDSGVAREPRSAGQRADRSEQRSKGRPAAVERKRTPEHR